MVHNDESFQVSVHPLVITPIQCPDPPDVHVAQYSELNESCEKDPPASVARDTADPVLPEYDDYLNGHEEVK